MKIDELALKFIDNTFEIELTTIELRQNTDNSVAIYFLGAGTIRIENSDSIILQMNVTKTNTSEIKWFMVNSELQSGQIFSENTYYKLLAKSPDGREWASERVSVNCLWNAHGEVKASAKLNRITGINQALSEINQVQVCFLDSEEIPVDPCIVALRRNSDGVKEAHKSFESTNCKFSVIKEKAFFYITATSDFCIKDNFDLRISEAIRFILAEPVYPTITIYNSNQIEKLVLRSKPIKSSIFKSREPISFKHNYLFEESWILFDKYLEYITNNTSGESWNVCSYHVWNALEASSGSYEGWVSGVTIAVEGLSTLIPFEMEESLRVELELTRSEVVDFLDKHETLREQKTRIKNLLGQMFNVRVQDRLHKLAKEKFIYEEDAKAWAKLRNKHLHPKNIDLRQLSTREYQKSIDLIHKCTVLMYHIIFYTIGYKGKFTDYGSLNFLTKDYPVSDSIRNK